MTTTEKPAVRYIAAAGSATAAVIYLLIGFNVITVVTDQGPGLVPPMLISGGLFALLSLLCLLSARHMVWMAGAGLQILVIVGYLAISSERNPAFEVWGIALKVVQVALLAAFGYLIVRSSRTGRLTA